MTDVTSLVERILELSKADDCVALGSRSSTVNVRWANNTATTNGATEGMNVAVLSVMGGRTGLVSRNNVTADTIEDLVRESEAACDGKPEADDYEELWRGEADPGWSDPAEPTSISVFEQFSPQLAELFERGGSDGVNLYGYAEHATTTSWLATSAGVRARNTFVRGSVDFTGKSSDLARSSWAGTFTKTFRDVDLDALYAKVQQRLKWAERTVEQPPGRYEVVLEPAAAADMIYYMYVAAARREADEGRSVFRKAGGGNRIGEKLFADAVNLYSDPAERGLEVPRVSSALVSSSYTSPFDAGMPVDRVDWVRKGVLQNLITTRNWARRSGIERAVPFVGNICFDSDGPSLDEMIASTERGLVLTCLWYIRVVDPQTLLLTGLTRDGVFMVEGGEVVGAVNNFRYNVSPVQMLADTTEVGVSAVCLPREFENALTKMPPLRVSDWNMSSVSEAT